MRKLNVILDVYVFLQMHLSWYVVLAQIYRDTTAHGFDRGFFDPEAFEKS